MRPVRGGGCPSSEITIRYSKISVMIAVVRPFVLDSRLSFHLHQPLHPKGRGSMSMNVIVFNVS